MQTSFKSHTEAFNAAVERARAGVAAGLAEADCEIGLEYNSLFKHYSIMALPRKENRSGWELRCEVVRASDPLLPVAK